MTNNHQQTEKVRAYYDQEADNYDELFKQGSKEYPTDLIRTKLILKLLKNSGIKTIMDAGCGNGLPMVMMLEQGFKAQGFDFSAGMVQAAKKELVKKGYSRDLVFQADLEDISTLPKEQFDAVFALGVFPHMLSADKALENLSSMLKKGGRTLIDFRNELFAAFTLNRYSQKFFLEKLIDAKNLPPAVLAEVKDFYAKALVFGKKIEKEPGKIDNSDILAKFHNPLTIAKELFKPHNFLVQNIYFLHYHPLPPFFENKYPKQFKEWGLKIENPNDWRGYLMASAFMVEAVKQA